MHMCLLIPAEVTDVQESAHQPHPSVFPNFLTQSELIQIFYLSLLISIFKLFIDICF